MLHHNITQNCLIELPSIRLPAEPVNGFWKAKDSVHLLNKLASCRQFSLFNWTMQSPGCNDTFILPGTKLFVGAEKAWQHCLVAVKIGVWVQALNVCSALSSWKINPISRSVGFAALQTVLEFDINKKEKKQSTAFTWFWLLISAPACIRFSTFALSPILAAIIIGVSPIY